MTVKELPLLREKGVCCELPAVDSEWANSTSAVLKALADPTRLTMMATLWRADGPVCICDFSGSLRLSQPTISHHMGRLRQAGLVESEKHGICMYYRLSERIAPATRALLHHLLT